MTTEASEAGRRATAGPARWVGIALVLAVAVGVIALVTGGGGTDCDQRLPGVRPGLCLTDPAAREAAPDQARPVLGEDARVSLDDYAGQVVVLNFWASWCGPCRAEQPELNQVAADLADLDVALLGVNVNDDSEANALAHEAEFAIPYPSIDDPAAQYAAAFDGIGPRTMPSTVLIDRQGRVAASIFGQTGYDEVVALATELATEGA